MRVRGCGSQRSNQECCRSRGHGQAAPRSPATRWTILGSHAHRVEVLMALWGEGEKVENDFEWGDVSFNLFFFFFFVICWSYILDYVFFSYILIPFCNMWGYVMFFLCFLCYPLCRSSTVKTQQIVDSAFIYKLLVFRLCVSSYCHLLIDYVVVFLRIFISLYLWSCWFKLW